MTSKPNFCFWLVGNLLQRNMALAEIKNKWENSSYNKKAEILSIRTFARYKADAQSLLDVVISCDRKNGNKYFIENKEELVSNQVYSWLLMSHKISHVSKQITNHKNVILESAPLGSDHLSAIIEAIKHKRLIRLSYKSPLQKFDRGDVSI